MTKPAVVADIFVAVVLKSAALNFVAGKKQLQRNVTTIGQTSREYNVVVGGEEPLVVKRPPGDQTRRLILTLLT